ncbi:MAG TPA: hypothetical protein VNU97_09150, partial [Rhizomicrobium sp.]|nr:hypothetical protein [Rhizomicrobium sp.]
MIYLLCALAFTVLIAFDRDPALEQASRRTVALGLDATRERLVQPGIALARHTGESLAAVMDNLARPSKQAPVPPEHRLAAAPPPQPVTIATPVAPPKPAVVA